MVQNARAIELLLSTAEKLCVTALCPSRTWRTRHNGGTECLNRRGAVLKTIYIQP